MKKALLRAFIPPTWPGRIYYAVFCALMLTIFWQSFDRSPPAKVLERTLLTEQVKPGESVRVRNKMLRYRDDTEVSIYRTLYDGCAIRWDYAVENLPAGLFPLGEDVYTSQITVPPGACFGQARIDAISCWARTFNLVHQIWPVCVPLKTVRFEIVQ